MGSKDKDDKDDKDKDKKDDKDKKEGCCAQVNEYATDKEVAQCTKQDDCDSCGALEKKGCEWREGKNADCDSGARRSEAGLVGAGKDKDKDYHWQSQHAAAVGAESRLSGWNVLLLLAAMVMVLAVYRCRKASLDSKLSAVEDEGRPLLGNNLPQV